MKLVKIEIGGQAYPVKYGYGALKLLAQAWELNDLGQVGAKISKLAAELGDLEKSQEPVGFDTLDALSALILAGIYNQDKNLIDTLDPDDVTEAMLINMPVLPDIFALFVASMGNYKAAKKTPSPGKRAGTRARKKA